MTFKFGALFDMDGVIIDNAEYHILAFKEWCDEKEIPFDRELFIRKHFGKQNGDIFFALTGMNMSDEEIVAEGNYKEAIYRRLYKGNIDPLTGLIEFLAALKSEEFGLALATSGPPENVSLILSEIGAVDMFDSIITCRDTSKGKPDPEVFLLAAEKLGLPAESCVVFEDSPAGAKAAVSAGCVLIGVSTGHEHLNDSLIMIEDFTGISAKYVANAIIDNVSQKPS